MPILTPEERVGGALAGKYRLERIEARGGMATIYRGVHAWTERPVAVKILHYEFAREEEVVRRFLQEARATSQLRHPNVVDVLDMGRDDDGTVYLVMELLEGETLRSRLRRGPLALDEVASLVLPAMRGVALAHQRGVVHRDLKPDNLFLARDGEVLVPKLLDFGVAKIGRGESSSTRTGTMVGTPHYMAPEQVRGERDVGPAADVWSMGVVLFLCLSGRLPFEADAPGGVIAKVLVDRAPRLRTVAPEVPASVAALVDRALEREPGARYADVGEMLGALEEALVGTVSGPRVVAPPASVDGSDTVLLAAGADAPRGTPPPAAPSAPRAGLTAPLAWGFGALAVLGVVTAMVWLLGRSEPVATALPPRSATLPAAASEPVFPVTPSGATPVGPPSGPATEPDTAASAEEAAPTEAAPAPDAAHDERDAAVAPGAEERAPGAARDGVASGDEETDGRAERAARPAGRAPRRGTRGALILR